MVAVGLVDELRRQVGIFIAHSGTEVPLPQHQAIIAVDSRHCGVMGELGLILRHVAVVLQVCRMVAAEDGLGSHVEFVVLAVRAAPVGLPGMLGECQLRVVTDGRIGKFAVDLVGIFGQ